ncbi:UDP-glucose dehydrogenase family protein [Deinococcus peraridilitoris]|uniref:UDP-glucose 6-dehydrogenase n=1 Tax=Deinococcus peraridilitoris (strain DSM 19664 / LMG 22246 / CIP 109416 / KR-200) TaxID=937777 RepID=L0A7U1_DEIPD|nr:UDP-glucose/GDP-mannose dehydrogenase family protein [Deinococcus peraridilitoris]AFZ69509.1 nucleotide sugar dehydrogenase [Deinococcus peraridilitoris DSM 19664]
MNVTIVGTGYVGLGTGVMLAYLGHQVIGLDTDPTKIESLKRGEIPIYEPGLDQLLAEAQANLHWTTDYAHAIPNADVIFICVGTPPQSDGRPNLSYLEGAARSIAQNLNGKTQVIVNKSTVPIGSGDWVSRIIEEHAVDYHANRYFVVSNPEFLREGTALGDSLYPDRIVLGGIAAGLVRMRQLYAPLIHQSFKAPDYVPRPKEYTVPAVVETTLTSAEMIKYAANAFLALKISYANEIAGLCERVGANIDEVTAGIGFDQRIGHRFLAAGAGWGGSCFGKDTSALITTGGDYGYEMPILSAAIEVNQRQRSTVIDKLQKHLRLLKGKRVAVLGMAFKPNTDDLRDAPAHDFIARLNLLGATVVAHDPVAMERARKEWAHLRYQEAATAQDAINGADAVIIATEWTEYRRLNWNSKVRSMRNALVIDARNVISEPLDVPAVIEQIGKELPERTAADAVA